LEGDEEYRTGHLKFFPVVTEVRRHTHARARAVAQTCMPAGLLARFTVSWW
jgi:hypothetical protein